MSFHVLSRGSQVPSLCLAAHVRLSRVLGRAGEPNGLSPSSRLLGGLSTAPDPLAEGELKCAPTRALHPSSVLARVGPLLLTDVLGQFRP